MKFLPNTIINFHAINSTDWLEKMFKIILKRYHVVSIFELEQYYYSNRPLRNCCHITFDDGHKSFYEIVYPLLKKYRIPVSLYVSPQIILRRENFWFQEIKGYDENHLLKIIKFNYNEIDKREGYDSEVKGYLKSMTIDEIWNVINEYQESTLTPPKNCVNLNLNQLIDLRDSNLVAIGAHTLTHPILNNETICKACSEIENSVLKLSELLDERVRYFAYPNGLPGIDFGKREIEILKNIDINLAFSTEQDGFNKMNNPLSIPRNGLSKGGQIFAVSKLALGRHWNTVKSILK